MKILYEKALDFDGASEGLRIRYPVSAGLVEYTFLHSVVPEKNCDLWRMSVVNALNEKGEYLHRLTKDHAEWEMALRLKGCPDFIGGFNHGDEIGEEPLFLLDGEEVRVEEIEKWRDCDKLEIRVESTGFDPACPERAVLKHCKSYCYDTEGVYLEQEVLWLEDAVLDGKFRSYLAMMPPVKHDPKEKELCITDSFSFDGDPDQRITSFPVEKREVRSLCISGRESGFRFTMAVENYDPLYPNSYLALLTDNGNCNYNKMYVAFAGGESEVIPAGTRWHSVTRYKIEKN